MVPSLNSIHWPGTQMATTGFEGPKLQIHLSNPTKGPNCRKLVAEQLAPHHAKVNKPLAENAVLIIKAP
jgi:hypothetical protein